MERPYQIPKRFTELVGTKQVFSGGLFSGKKNLPEAEYMVHDIRWGTAQVVNYKELLETGKSSYCHPTVELLLSARTLKRKQWSRGFSVTEIDLYKLEEEEKK